MKNSEKILETSWQFSWSYEMTTYDQIIPLLGIYPREMKLYIHKNKLYVNIYNRCIHNRKNLEITQYPSSVIPLCHGISSVQFSCSVVSDSFWPMNHSTPGLPVHHHSRSLPNSCPLSQWCKWSKHILHSHQFQIFSRDEIISWRASFREFAVGLPWWLRW